MPPFNTTPRGKCPLDPPCFLVPPHRSLRAASVIGPLLLSLGVSFTWAAAAVNICHFWTHTHAHHLAVWACAPVSMCHNCVTCHERNKGAFTADHLWKMSVSWLLLRVTVTLLLHCIVKYSIKLCKCRKYATMPKS